MSIFCPNSYLGSGVWGKSHLGHHLSSLAVVWCHSKWWWSMAMLVPSRALGPSFCSNILKYFIMMYVFVLTLFRVYSRHFKLRKWSLSSEQYSFMSTVISSPTSSFFVTTCHHNKGPVRMLMKRYILTPVLKSQAQDQMAPFLDQEADGLRMEVHSPP